MRNLCMVLPSHYRLFYSEPTGSRIGRLSTLSQTCVTKIPTKRNSGSEVDQSCFTSTLFRPCPPRNRHHATSLPEGEIQVEEIPYDLRHRVHRGILPLESTSMSTDCRVP